jgi:integrase
MRGLRASEIALLQLSDFEERAGTLYVHRLKGSFSQVKKLMPPELHALRMWIRERGR